MKSCTRECPKLSEEVVEQLRDKAIVGVDEVGRGSWAGPILAVAAAVPSNWIPAPGLTDSKKLSPKKREAFFQRYQNDDKVILGVGIVGSEDIDRMGIDWAQAEAQAIAIRKTFWELPHPPFVVVDGIAYPNVGPPEIEGVLLIPKGDILVPAISLASVIAKVTRDRIMTEYDTLYPGYGFTGSSGYGTKQHHEALKRLGLCPIHRKSYRPVAVFAEANQEEGLWKAFDD